MEESRRRVDLGAITNTLLNGTGTPPASPPQRRHGHHSRHKTVAIAAKPPTMHQRRPPGVTPPRRSGHQPFLCAHRRGAAYRSTMKTSLPPLTISRNVSGCRRYLRGLAVTIVTSVATITMPPAQEQ
mgnify:FL=1